MERCNKKLKFRTRNFLILNTINKLVRFYEEKNFTEIEKTTLTKLKNNPEDEDMNFFLGLALSNTGRFENAIIHFLKSASNKNYKYDCFLNIAGCYHAISNIDLALEFYHKCIDINSEKIEPYKRIANCYRFQRNYDLSIQYLQNAIKLKKDKHIYFQLGSTYREMGNFFEARINFKNSISVDANFYEAKLALANLDLDEGKLKSAFNGLREIINNNKISEDLMIAAKIDLGNYYKSLGEYFLAIEIYLDVLKLSPKNPSASYNLSLCYLFQKKFNLAWVYHEKRKDLDVFGQLQKRFNTLTKPIWNESRPKTNLLIWGEQGIGDVILYSQFIETIKLKFSNLTLAVDKKLIIFFTKIFPDIKIIDIDFIGSYSNYEYHLPMGSLGLYFQQGINNLEHHTIQNYPISTNLIPKKSKRIRCGISWRSTNKLFGHKKSINLLQLRNILANKEIEFFSLQFSPELNEIKDLQKDLGFMPFQKHSIDCFNDIDGIASLIKSCDIIISISNTNAHIAGKMGIKTILLLPLNDGKLWYWGPNSDEDIIWYPSIKPLRQKKEGDWLAPINMLEKEIEKLL